MQTLVSKLVKGSAILIVGLWTVSGFIVLLMGLQHARGMEVLIPLSLLAASVLGLNSYNNGGRRADGLMTQDKINYVGAGLILGVVLAWSIATVFLYLFLENWGSVPAWLFIISALAFCWFGISGCKRYKTLAYTSSYDPKRQIEIRPNSESLLLFGFLLFALVSIGLLGMQ